MSNGLFGQIGNLINEYFLEPVSTTMGELYTDSVLEKVVNYPLLETGSSLHAAEFSGIGERHTIGSIGSVVKDFAGGFLNIGSAKTGGSGLYTHEAYQAPPPKLTRAGASRVTSGMGSYRPTEVDLGLTDRVKTNLYKATLSNTPAIKNLINQMNRNASRRAGTRTRVASSSFTGVKQRTSMPYAKKPKYYG